MRRTAIVDVVGLCPRLIGEHTPRIAAYARQHALARIEPVVPAVTCTAQATYLTGQPPAAHGIVANGWYNRELAEHHFWKQSNHLVQGEKLWEILRREQDDFTCAKLFWWFNMYASVDFSITPRPMYPADGRKVFDIYSQPLSIRDAIKEDLGDFPFPAFWGPMAGLASSRWIAASARWIEERHAPTLSLVYLPHLDYNLQRLGPADPALAEDLAAIDAIVGELLDFYAAREVQVALLSEYAITPVSRSIAPNRLFRQQGWLTIKLELGRELLDCGASRVFAITDHQVAHIYVRDRELLPRVRQVLEGVEGIDQVLDGFDHPRSGDLLAVAEEDAWFTYYYWEHDDRAPDFARCVDIHRKYGYDPVELFLDPDLLLPELRICGKLLGKKLGLRTLMDVIPLDPGLVKGSHGCRPAAEADWPVLIGPDLPPRLAAVQVRDWLLAFCRDTG